MNLRIWTNLALGLLATFMVVASLVFSPALVGWLMLALAVVALVAMAQVGRSRAVAEQVVDGLTVLLALWSLAASVAFAGAALKWLSFAEAVGFVALALDGTGTAIAVAFSLDRREPDKAAAHTATAPLDRRPEELGTVA